MNIMSFTDVIGQELPITILKNSIKNQRISHAYLFTGQQGAGKELTAAQFAKAVNCKEMQFDACEECISCRKFNSWNHPDIVEITPDGNYIKIDQIREMKKEVSYKPYESNWKVYIIKEAEKMNLQAANSLLRILEEPPEYIIIIILASRDDLLLATITSRCQIVKFRPLTVEEITDKLISDFGLNEKIARKRAILAGGSLDKAISFSEEEDVLVRREEILNKVKNLVNLNLVEVFELVQQILDYKEEIHDVLKNIITFYRDILLYKGSGNLDLLINFDYKDDLVRLSDEYTISELQGILDLLEETNNLIRNTNIKLQLALEVMLIKIKEKRV
jgi:DNA polymerase-3 subunit delta'